MFYQDNIPNTVILFDVITTSKQLMLGYKQSAPQLHDFRKDLTKQLTLNQSASYDVRVVCIQSQPVKMDQ